MRSRNTIEPPTGTMLYGIFSYCNGLRELCEGRLACEGKLSHLGFDKAPARGTISNANNKRSYPILSEFAGIRHNDYMVIFENLLYLCSVIIPQYSNSSISPSYYPLH